MSITSEQILTSVSTVVNEALSTYKQDQTILAKIEQGGSGKVLCSSGALKFYAYGEDNKNYNANQQVYVLVPQGDYSQKKIILGAYSIENEEKNIYTSSNKLKDFVSVTVDTDITIPYPVQYDAAAITLTPKSNEELKPFKTYLQVAAKKKVAAQIAITDGSLRGSRTLNPKIKYDFLAEVDKEVNLQGETWVGQFVNDEEYEPADSMFNITWSFGYLSPKKQIKTYFPEYYSSADVGYIEVIGDLKAGSIFNNNIHEVIIYTYQIGSGESAAGANWKQVGYFNNQITGGSLINSTCFKKDSHGAKINLKNLFFDNAETTKFKIRATLIDSDEWIESDIITVKNPNKEQITKETVNEGITLSLADGDSGIYNFYGLDNEIKNDEDKKTRYIQVKSKGEIESVIWDYPKILTGIEPLETQNEKDKFFYKIKRRCYTTYVNNTIKCTATFKNGTTAQADITLSFGGFGTQETPYSLNIDFARDKKYLVCGERPVKMRATLERTDGEAATFKNITYKWEWLAKNSIVKFCDAAGNETSNPTGAEVYVKPPGYDKLAQGGYNSVIKVTVENIAVNDITALDLEAYLPLGLCGDTADTSLYMYQGPVRIVYDGLNECSYDSSKIVLYKDGRELPLDERTTLGGTCIFNEYNPPDGTTHYLTYIDTDKNSIRISPKTYVMVNDKPSIDTLYIPKNGEDDYLWAQPILTLRNRWTNKTYNWTGKEVQTSETFVLTPFLAAGTLESDKTFTGTMLGEQDNIWGIFGYQKGVPRYSFTEDGTMYIGQKNGSYITFNDDGELYINAESFNLSTADGSYIKSGSNGTLEINTSNFELSSDNIEINKRGLKIKGNGDFSVHSSKKEKDVLYFDSATGNLTLEGAVKAISGNIGEWNIDNTKISGTTIFSGQTVDVKLDKNNYGLNCTIAGAPYFKLSPKEVFVNSSGVVYFAGNVRISGYEQFYVNAENSLNVNYQPAGCTTSYPVASGSVIHRFYLTAQELSDEWKGNEFKTPPGCIEVIPEGFNTSEKTLLLSINYGNISKTVSLSGLEKWGS